MKGKLTPEQRSAIAKARDAKLTPEQLSARGKRLNAAKLSKYSSRDLSAFSKKAAQTRWAKPQEHDVMSKMAKAYWEKLTPEQRSARAKKSAAKVTPEQRRARAIKGKAAFMAKHPPEERSAIARKAAAKKPCPRDEGMTRDPSIDPQPDDEVRCGIEMRRVLKA